MFKTCFWPLKFTHDILTFEETKVHSTMIPKRWDAHIKRLDNCWKCKQNLQSLYYKFIDPRFEMNEHSANCIFSSSQLEPRNRMVMRRSTVDTHDINFLGDVLANTWGLKMSTQQITIQTMHLPILLTPNNLSSLYNNWLENQE